MTTLTETFKANPYQAYVYAYPHKTAYRPLQPQRALKDLWQEEKTDALFLYFHIPFCEQRCGYCNLFTTAESSPSLREQYLQQMTNQAKSVLKTIGPDLSFARLAVGGGTPSLLSLEQLQFLFTTAHDVLGLDLKAIPISFEVSPETINAEKLAFLKDIEVNRISIGIQSFMQEELTRISRHANLTAIRTALKAIQAVGFETLNLDLIYGLPGQTLASWTVTLQEALRYAPEEIYLYPLYVRPLTGLEQSQKASRARLDHYRTGRDILLEAGYQQYSMRMFRKGNTDSADAPAYTCQEDGMVGLGCGARSYTRAVHYSSEYAVGLQSVQEILSDYVSLSPDQFRQVIHGFILNHDEQARRYLLKSLLRCEGLSLADYQAYLGSDPLNDLPAVESLLEENLAVIKNGRLQLTETGIMFSDAIGPWLYSRQVRELMTAYDLR